MTEQAEETKSLVPAKAAPYDFSEVQSFIDRGVLDDHTIPFPPLQNDLLLRAARREPVDRIPVWCHRQAGRYLPEFKAVRAGHGFFESCETPLHAAELTLQPIRRKFPLDAAIIFSDILVIPRVLGLTVEMKPGPVLPVRITNPSSLTLVKSLNEVDINAGLKYVFDAIRLTRHALQGKVPLLGFSGAPFTLFCYMVEGGSSKSWDEARRFMYEYPDATHTLMRRLTETIIEYLVLQVHAGAQMLEVFDTQAGSLSPALWDTFVEPYLREIATSVKHQLRERGLDVVPMTVFPMGAHWALNSLSYSDYDVIAIDWHTNPQWARSQVGDRVALQGNLDPSALFADPDQLRELVGQMARGFGLYGYIANLGHGMLPTHTPEALYTFADELREVCKTLPPSQPPSSWSSSSSLLPASPTQFFESLQGHWGWLLGGAVVGIIVQRVFRLT